MIHEFAVEPAAIDNWKDFRFIYDQVGVEHGRLISRFPKEWAKRVMDAVKTNPLATDGDRKKIEVRLQSLKKSKMIRMNREYNPCMDWMLNVQTQQKQNPFHAIIGRCNEIAADNFLNIDDLDASHTQWQVPKERAVHRRAWDLACCARCLLQISKEIIIVDPHFDPAKSRFLETFSHMITFIFEQRAPGRVEVHAEYDYYKEQKRETEWQEDLKNLSRLIPEGFALNVFRWEAKQLGDKPHARYVLTELGGIRYDYGTDEWKDDGQTTDVSLMDHSLYEKRWRDYQKETAVYHLYDNFTVTGSQKIPEKGA